MTQNTEQAILWIEANLDQTVIIDKKTLECSKIPDYVRSYIKEKWEYSDTDGGSFLNVEYIRPSVLKRPVLRRCTNSIKELNSMDHYNKAAYHIMNKKGIDTAVKHMFTDQETGKKLSYSEMRDRYG